MYLHSTYNMVDINQLWCSLIKSINTYTYFNHTYINERIWRT